MENVCRIGSFNQLEKYVRDNEERLAGEEETHNTVYVNDTNVLQYPYQVIPNAGVWLQDRHRHISIYATGETGEVV